MSTLGDKTKNITDTEVACFSCNSNSRNGFIILLFIAGLTISMIFGWVVFPKLLYSQKQQPFNFNHVLHLNEVSESCRSCHYFYDDGSFSGIPKLEECISCHDEAIGESYDEAIFIEEYVNKNREVPWLVYSKQPDCVFFSHAAHLKSDNSLNCVTCHGHIGESEISRPYEYNRITGYSRDIWGKNIAGIKINSWDRMKMDDCAKCHKDVQSNHNSSVQTGRDACFVCHK